MTSLNRRSFLASAAALAAASAAPASTRAAAPPHPATGFLSLLRTPDRATAWLGEDPKPVSLTRSNNSFDAPGINVHTIPDTNSASGDLRILLACPHLPLSRIHLRWQLPVQAGILILGEAWERSYGDLAWRSIVPERVLPWYFATHSAGLTHSYGVKTDARAFCFWQIDPQGVSLWLDTSNGGSGVLLGDLELIAATVVSHPGQPGESPTQAIAQLCRLMCPTSRLSPTPIYGFNDWYYAYGASTAQSILRDTDLLATLAPTSGPRPFSVIDGGWSGGAGDSDIYVPNSKFPDMAALAAQIRQRNARPGLWIRPTLATKSTNPALLLPEARFKGASDAVPTYDPTIPEALDAMLAKLTQPIAWGYELIKHDFSTFDFFGLWGFQMGPSLTRPNWRFHDTSRTNAEILRDYYLALRRAAPGRLILGCNTVGHLSAGILEASRIGDDTSGQHWERTRRMGINTLAHRLPQNRTFFAIDPDCVGITPDIPWTLNRQWLDLIARSGAVLFVSADPNSTGPEQQTALREAFQIAASGQSTATPLDGLTSTTPIHWDFHSAKATTHRDYDWTSPDGADPYPI